MVEIGKEVRHTLVPAGKGIRAAGAEAVPADHVQLAAACIRGLAGTDL